MKLSVSNIAWESGQDERIYQEMKRYGFMGLEIAPTRWFPEAPYEHVREVREYSLRLRERYGFRISSMQSIWFGRTESIWGPDGERNRLKEYTWLALDFAAAAECGNLVFGCPRNRNRPEGAEEADVLSFFQKLGFAAEAHGAVIALEANPSIYHTNYINHTAEAINLIRCMDCPGIGLNLDVGTMIENGETVEKLEGAWPYISHVHVSEPFLKPVEKHALHGELAAALRENAYKGYVSVEMGKQEDLLALIEAMAYVAEVFG